MLKHGSKISAWMLIVVFCAFAFAGCGNTNTNDETADGPAESQQTQEMENSDELAPEKEKTDAKLTVSTPTTDSTVEGGKLEVIGKAEGAPNPGKDKVHMELVTKSGEKLGEADSLVADLDYEFSGEIKYEISDNMKKNDDGTIDAELRIYIEMDNDGRREETTVKLKVK
ncbi:MAG: hypothetical protein IKV45_02840 [Firmicutes bacterium]|nr:hypothetical protein [Bacillota bacterium]